LLIAVAGVAGVLAFGVSARTHEYGVRLAVGSAPRQLLVGVLSEGVRIIAVGTMIGAVAAYVFAAAAATVVGPVSPPGLGSIFGAAALLLVAAIAASLMPAARASRVDVLQALRSE
jgi:ABC-type antimicrobial peptide transport system permease subunit